MPADPDWLRMESAISVLLRPARGAPTARAELLKRLAEYANAAIREARALGAIIPHDEECVRALDWLLRPVFICGHQRSGTTLVQNLLDGHPLVLSLPSEGTYFSSFAYIARRNPPERDMDRFAAEWTMRFVDPNFEPHFRLGRSDANRNPAIDFARMLFGWHAAIRRHVPPELAALLALVAAFRQATAPTSVPHIWVEKTPRNEAYVARFAFFKSARFVHVVRDPRATLASLSRIYGSANIGPFDAPEYARTIGQSLRLARLNSHRLRNRYLVVRYEDLVERPIAEIERVRTFLDITPHASLLVPTAGGEAVVANSSFGAGAAGTIERISRPDFSHAEHMALLGAYAASAARQFGYEVPRRGSIVGCAIRLKHWPRHALRGSRAWLRVARFQHG